VNNSRRVVEGIKPLRDRWWGAPKSMKTKGYEPPSTEKRFPSTSSN
jgi:hypothetical protein